MVFVRKNDQIRKGQLISLNTVCQMLHIEFYDSANRGRHFFFSLFQSDLVVVPSVSYLLIFLMHKPDTRRSKALPWTSPSDSRTCVLTSLPGSLLNARQELQPLVGHYCPAPSAAEIAGMEVPHPFQR